MPASAMRDAGRVGASLRARRLAMIRARVDIRHALLSQEVIRQFHQIGGFIGFRRAGLARVAATKMQFL